MLGEEEEEASTHSRATGSTESLQGAIRAQGSTGWCWSQEQSCSRAERGCGDTAEFKGFSITLLFPLQAQH